MIPEKLPPAALRSVLRGVRQNGRKEENGHGEKPGWCSAHTESPWMSSEPWLKAEFPLLLVPSLPEDPFAKPLQAPGIMSESRRLKQMVTEPFLSSTHPWCCSAVGKKWKAESYLGGELDCFLLSYNSLNLKLLSNAVFFPVLPTQNCIIFNEIF